MSHKEIEAFFFAFCSYTFSYKLKFDYHEEERYVINSYLNNTFINKKCIYEGGEGYESCNVK